MRCASSERWCGASEKFARPKFASPKFAILRAKKFASPKFASLRAKIDFDMFELKRIDSHCCAVSELRFAGSVKCNEGFRQITPHRNLFFYVGIYWAYATQIRDNGICKAHANLFKNKKDIDSRAS